LAFYRCGVCEEAIDHQHKARMVSEGRWRPRNPGAKIAGFRLSELVSPWRTWGELAEDWLKAQVSIEKLRAFLNTSACELWDDTAQANVTEAELLARRETIGPMLPEGVAVIVAGVDVQGDRAEVSCSRSAGARKPGYCSIALYPAIRAGRRCGLRSIRT
jgi:phage terminase large subunit GpA-like protein